MTINSLDKQIKSETVVSLDIFSEIEESVRNLEALQVEQLRLLSKGKFRANNNISESINNFNVKLSKLLK